MLSASTCNVYQNWLENIVYKIDQSEFGIHSKHSSIDQKFNENMFRTFLHAKYHQNPLEVAEDS